MGSTDKGLLERLRELLHRQVVPRRGFSLGWLVVILFGVQVLTGILLSFYYQPSPAMAYDSIRFIMRDVTTGWLIRGMHYWTGQLLLILGLVQVVRVFLSGAYKSPRQVDWFLGFLLLVLVLTFAFTGNLLPWDQTAYWSAVQALDWLDDTPVVGAPLALFFRGGDQVTAATLSRFYSIHILLLPWITFYLLALHVWMLAGRQRSLRGGEES